MWAWGLYTFGMCVCLHIAIVVTYFDIFICNRGNAFILMNWNAQLRLPRWINEKLSIPLSNTFRCGEYRKFFFTFNGKHYDKMLIQSTDDDEFNTTYVHMCTVVSAIMIDVWINKVNVSNFWHNTNLPFIFVFLVRLKCTLIFKLCLIVPFVY